MRCRQEGAFREAQAPGWACWIAVPTELV